MRLVWNMMVDFGTNKMIGARIVVVETQKVSAHLAVVLRELLSCPGVN